MKHRPFIGVRMEGQLFRAMGASLRSRGWREKIVPFTGYGTPKRVRILARLVLSSPARELPLPSYAADWLNRRGWRNFFAPAAPHGLVRISIADQSIEVRSDRSGYIDVTIDATGLTPGWHHATLESEGAAPVHVPVQVVSEDEDFGIISDIDDTIITTWLPRLFLAVWNSFIQLEGNRQAVPGMARMYQKMLEAHPGAPVIYVSTGPWSAAPFLKRFMERHGFPPGAKLLTDLGPTNTGWFRSGPDHKRYSFGELARDFPTIRWVLVGDDGQHDPVLYREFAELHPDRVRAIAIRTLTPAEQILAHGTMTVLQESADLRLDGDHQIPEVTGDDGDDLWPALRQVLRVEA